jgi:hypothetical protein
MASVSSWASIPCGTEREEGVRRRASGRGERGGQRRVAGYSTTPITDEVRRRSLSSSARDFDGLAAVQRGEKREK